MCYSNIVTQVKISCWIKNNVLTCLCLLSSSFGLWRRFRINFWYKYYQKVIIIIATMISFLIINMIISGWKLTCNRVIWVNSWLLGAEPVVLWIQHQPKFSSSLNLDSWMLQNSTYFQVAKYWQNTKYCKILTKYKILRKIGKIQNIDWLHLVLGFLLLVLRGYWRLRDLVLGTIFQG